MERVRFECVDPLYQMPDGLWTVIEAILPEQDPKPKGGAPRKPDRQMMTGIFYVLRTGCQWKAVPRCLGAGSTIHDRFQEWRKIGVFQKLFKTGLIFFDNLKGIEWEWQAMDGAITKAPLGQEQTGANPTDRSKSGVKRCLLVEGSGIPIGIAVAGANRNDMKMTEDTLKTMAIKRPDPEIIPQNMCLDKGFDYEEVREILSDWRYTAHIRTRGEEKRESMPGYRARRWVVERTHSWLNRFRRLLVRWEKKVNNYLAMLHFACAHICLRASGVFG